MFSMEIYIWKFYLKVQNWFYVHLPKNWGKLCCSVICLAYDGAGIWQVIHGADSDSIWLQRDFHIYIVNLFDTARVSVPLPL